jgi:hypothetical protein
VTGKCWHFRVVRQASLCRITPFDEQPQSAAPLKTAFEAVPGRTDYVVMNQHAFLKELRDQLAGTAADLCV